MNRRHETCNREVLVQQIQLLEGDFTALNLLRFPLGLTSTSGFSVSFQIMLSILESEPLITQQDKDENDESEWTVVK